MAVAWWSAGVILAGAVSACCVLLLPSAVLPFSALHPQSCLSLAMGIPAAREFICVTEQTWALHSKNRFKAVLLTAPLLHFIVCDY